MTTKNSTESSLKKRVLLVDADLHKPRIHEVFRVSNRVGLVSVLAENLDPLSAINKTNVKNLSLSQAAILFFVACGLTLIFGIMRVVNFAHGVIFMLGAYVGLGGKSLTGCQRVSGGSSGVAGEGTSPRIDLSRVDLPAPEGPASTIIRARTRPLSHRFVRGSPAGRTRRIGGAVGRGRPPGAPGAPAGAGRSETGADPLQIGDHCSALVARPVQQRSSRAGTAPPRSTSARRRASRGPASGSGPWANSRQQSRSRHSVIRAWRRPRWGTARP